MAAPAGVGSGSTQEPANPEPGAAEQATLEQATVEQVAVHQAATGPLALEAAVPEPSPPAPGESMAAEVHAGERRGVGPRLAVAGVILVLVAVAAAAGVLVVATHGFRHKTVVTYRPVPGVFSLRAGDCLNSSQNGLSVTILSCATPHEAEVFATFSLTGSMMPGPATRPRNSKPAAAARTGSRAT